VAYVRQHGANTSVTAFRSANYYAEHHRIGELLRKRWEAPEMVLRRLSANLESQYARVDAGRCIAPLDQLFSVRRIAELRRTQPHILMAMLGFELGGGEIFPINLANALVQQGRLVSMMILNSEREDPKIRSRLDRRVAVYDAHLVREMGQGRFLRAAGVDLIHSHNVSLEYFFFVNSSERLSTPYLVTLHGSYECAQIEPRALAKITQGVDQWVYLSEKNLGHLEGERSTAHHIANGAPRDERPFHTRRADMGIDAGDFVFAIASRPLRSKGWEEAILALQAAQRRTDRRLRLLLCGDGPEAAPLRQKYQSDSVRFLGYQEQVVGLFRLADCVLLPTRFAGESFPLCLIEAFQAGAPVIATAIGEIPHMLRSGASYAGELLTPTEDDAAFVSALAEAMVRFANDKSPLAAYARTAKALAKTYDIENTVAQYAQLYEEMISKRASVAAAAR
jgi:glycosyltransferase involved in cell wall biosynthesis